MVLKAAPLLTLRAWSVLKSHGPRHLGCEEIGPSAKHQHLRKDGHNGRRYKGYQAQIELLG